MLHTEKEKDPFPGFVKLQVLSERTMTSMINTHVLSTAEPGHARLPHMAKSKHYVKNWKYHSEGRGRQVS